MELVPGAVLGEDMAEVLVLESDVDKAVGLDMDSDSALDVVPGAVPELVSELALAQVPDAEPVLVLELVAVPALGVELVLAQVPDVELALGVELAEVPEPDAELVLVSEPVLVQDAVRPWKNFGYCLQMQYLQLLEVQSLKSQIHS